MSALNLNKNTKLMVSCSPSAIDYEDGIGQVLAENDTDHQHSICPSPRTSCEIEDEHYAVAEEIIENARQRSRSHNENWLAECSAEFSRNHGKIVEGPCATAAEEDDVDTGTKACQEYLSPGICRQDPIFRSDRFYQLSQQMKNLLRFSRGIRRTQGYVPDHLLSLWCDPDDRSSIKECMLLTRVSYSPFDATAVQLEMIGRNRARIVVKEFPGPEFLSLPMILKTMSARMWTLYHAKYKALSLGEIEIDLNTVQEPAIVNGDDGADDNDSSSEGEESRLSTQHALIKQALQPANTKKRRNTTTTTTNTLDPEPKRVKRTAPATSFLDARKATKSAHSKLGIKSVQNDSENLGVADDIDRQIMTEWEAAATAQAGPLPPTNPSASHEKAQAESATGSQTVPVLSKVYPWRDDKGYCWKFNAKNGKAMHLGLELTESIVCFICSTLLLLLLSYYTRLCYIILAISMKCKQ